MKNDRAADCFRHSCPLSTEEWLSGCASTLIFTRDGIYAIARIWHANSVCPSVRPSVTRVYRIVSKLLNVSSKFFHHLIGPSF